MIKSMTGYGKAEAILETGKITVEIRTLNGKSADINIKTQVLPKDKDIVVRHYLAQELQRGTIDFFATWEPNASESAKKINTEMVKEYYSQITGLRKELEGFSEVSASQSIMNNEVLTAILRIPDVIDTKKSDVVNDENWPIVEKAIQEAVAHVNEFRAQEGKILYKDVTSRVKNILALYDEVEKYEPERIATVKEKLLKKPRRTQPEGRSKPLRAGNDILS